jgi:predicted amidohydrolase YtcJ
LRGAATRCAPIGDRPDGWFSEQRISVEEAIRGFTVGAAASVGESPRDGTLTPGAHADLTIWRDDPFTAPAQRLLEIGIGGGGVGRQGHLTEQN